MNGKLTDVWNGSVLQTYISQDSFFNDSPLNLAVTLCTDGIPIYKSSSITLWPILLMILNLPPLLRQKAENIILCGLWYGPNKPDASLLLDPVMKVLNNLYEKGFEIKRSQVQTQLCRVKLVSAVFDLIARALVLKMKQFNGEYGCSVCLHPGKQLGKGTRVYLPGVDYTMRTHINILHDAKLAESNQLPVNGVKGVSPLSSILNLVNQIPLDYMHCVLEGVVKRLMHLWFDSCNHEKPYYLGKHLRIIDQLLEKQRPPHEFSRRPRSISKHLNYWKASEYKNWLLFYSVPILKGHLPSLYYHHYVLLVSALHILLQESISLEQLNAAEMMIKDFISLMPELYGENNCTANVHMLLHLPIYARMWGPLWTQSTFAFESKNGHLKQLSHGKSSFYQQMLFNIDVSQTLQLIQSISKFDDLLLQTMLKSNRGVQLHHMACIGQHTYFLNDPSIEEPNADERNALCCTGRIVKYRKLLRHGVLYCASTTKASKQDSSVCAFIEPSTNTMKFGRIQSFVHTSQPMVLLSPYQVTSILKEAGPTCRECLNMYKEIDILAANNYAVKIIQECSNIIAVPIKAIIAKSMVVVIDNVNRYLVRQPNMFEHN